MKKFYNLSDWKCAKINLQGSHRLEKCFNLEDSLEKY